ncbi:MAG: 50S ribosomal protein L3 [Tenericutes bacterium]|jgi:large subunit ribosomal protein L3|nr:50S ribosomal protein L3 [Mycoplasmatota bacterium]
MARKGILGRKEGMTQIFDENGNMIPVTVISAEPNVVLQKKTVETDGYESVQLGFMNKRANLINKPLAGHFAKTETTPKRYIKEMRLSGMKEYKPGQEVKIDIFTAGDFVDVTGTSKGKGYQGVIKRHNQHIGPMSHGSKYHRGVGSMGVISPNHIRKGKNMPGRMGHETVTIQNLQVVRVDAERNIILIKGNVPGPNRSLIVIKNAIKK